MEIVDFLLLVLSHVDFYESGENKTFEKAGGNIYTFRSVLTKAERSASREEFSLPVTSPLVRRRVRDAPLADSNL